MKMLKRVAVGTMCLTMMASTMSFIKANNSSDTSFSVYVSSSGGDESTTARAKKDNTYTYVRLDSGAAFSFAAQAKKGIKAGQTGNPDSHDYSSAWHTLGAGKRIYIPNRTHAVGIANTYLTIGSTDHKSHTYKGAWSPDNFSGFGEP